MKIKISIMYIKFNKNTVINNKNKAFEQKEIFQPARAKPFYNLRSRSHIFLFIMRNPYASVNARLTKERRFDTIQILTIGY